MKAKGVLVVSSDHQDWKNKLYFGDNLNVLREHVQDETADLIYLDPPFNSNATYNVLFREKGGEQSAAQITAFEDTWRWGLESEHAYHEVVTEGPKRLADLLQSMRAFLGQNDMMAYLTMMAQRIVELHRVLKQTGSIYLHCDPTASHYLKLLMDAVFSPIQFRNEIVWRRTGSHNSSRRFGPTHDILLFYSKSDSYYFKKVYRPYMKGHADSYFKKSDEKGRFWTNALTGAGTRNGESGQAWSNYNPTARGRHWAIPGRVVEELGLDGSLTVHQKLDGLDAAGYILHPPEGSGAMPTYHQYLEESPGMPIQDIWAYQPYTRGLLIGTDEGIEEDVRWLVAQGDPERLGFPTQKPAGLLSRIISSSCPDGGVVLDPFCGCGTTVMVAEEMNRRWMGIDITHLAITLIRHRLQDTFGSKLSPYEIVGDPKDVASAEALAHEDPYKFEWWALGLADARPARDRKKGADTGIDGYLNFFDDNSGKAKTVIVQVKSGHVSVSQVRDLKGTLDREKAPLGVFITLKEPTRPMREEAVAAGFYEPDHFPGLQFPRLQIVTIEELLAGQAVQYPRLAPTVTFKRAERRRTVPRQEQSHLL